jgi:hypothetical protein
MKYSYLWFIFVALLFFHCQSQELDSAQEEARFAELESIITAIESELTPLEKDVSELAALASYLIEHQNVYAPKADRNKYTTSSTGVFYNPEPAKGESSVYISTLAKDRQSAINEVYTTELLDSAFYETVTQNQVVAQAYYNSKNQISRLYPSYSVLTMVDPALDLTSFNFYYLADEVRNPYKGAKWLEEVYLDPAGRGWVLSVIHPVYYRNILQGVMGIDITVNDLVGNFLDKSDKNLLIVDGNGTIVAGKAKAIEALNMPPLKNHTYIQTINSDNFPVEDFNLFKSKSKEVRRMVSKFLLEKNNRFELALDGKNQKVFCKQINLVNWYLIDIDNL